MSFIFNTIIYFLTRIQMLLSLSYPSLSFYLSAWENVCFAEIHNTCNSFDNVLTVYVTKSGFVVIRICVQWSGHRRQLQTNQHQGPELYPFYNTHYTSVQCRHCVCVQRGPLMRINTGNRHGETVFKSSFKRFQLLCV